MLYQIKQLVLLCSIFLFSTQVLTSQDHQIIIQSSSFKLKNVLPNFSKRENLIHISKQVPGFQILFSKTADHSSLDNIWTPKSESLLITTVLDDLLERTNYYYRIHSNNIIVVEPYLQWLKIMDVSLHQINLGPRNIYKAHIKKHLEHFFEHYNMLGIKYKISFGLKNHINIESNKVFNQQSKSLFATIDNPLMLKHDYLDPNLFQSIQTIKSNKTFDKNKFKLTEWLHLISMLIEQKESLAIDEKFKPLFEAEFLLESNATAIEVLKKISKQTGVQIYYHPAKGLYVEKPYFKGMSHIAQREYRTYYIGELTKTIPFIYLKAKILDLDKELWENIEYDIYYNPDMKLMTVCCPLYLMPKIDILLQKIMAPILAEK